MFDTEPLSSSPRVLAMAGVLSVTHDGCHGRLKRSCALGKALDVLSRPRGVFDRLRERIVGLLHGLGGFGHTRDYFGPAHPAALRQTECVHHGLSVVVGAGAGQRIRGLADARTYNNRKTVMDAFRMAQSSRMRR